MPPQGAAVLDRPVNRPGQVLFASMIGTTIEFFDFYIYANAAVLVFPRLFFPSTDPASGILASLATFAIAFFARPIGSALFGHFGDRIGRKATLVAALLTMGVSTMAIGCCRHIAASESRHLRCLRYVGLDRDSGLGGEWGGAVLLAVENAPPGNERGTGCFRNLARRSVSSSRVACSCCYPSG
jgi:MFS family permease